MHFLYLLIIFVYADMSGGLNLQLIDELQRQAQFGLKPYESSDDERVKKAGQEHGRLYQKAQEASRAELRAAEKIEASFRASGHKWTEAQINQAIDRMSTHIQTASRIQQSAFQLRGKIFAVFNNLEKPNLYNPARFYKLVKLEGLKWLDTKSFDVQTKGFIPENWRIVAYGSSSKPRTEIRGVYDGESLVRQAYSDLYSKGQKSNVAEMKFDSIRTTLSNLFSRSARGPTLKAPGGWMKTDSNPLTIGQ